MYKKMVVIGQNNFAQVLKLSLMVVYQIFVIRGTVFVNAANRKMKCYG